MLLQDKRVLIVDDESNVRLNFRTALETEDYENNGIEVTLQFTFPLNSLNALLSLISENDTHSRAAITQLAEIFRSSLQAANEHLITLRRKAETVSV